jgi:hypothetical protein
MASAFLTPAMATDPTTRSARRPSRAPARLAAAAVAAGLLLLLPREAAASFLSPEAEDSLATFIALFVIFVVPVVLIVLFWLVHILPEKIAHKRHHPQFEAIRTLCLLSLVFGGLLWPLAWIWAYTRPVLHKMAYGTDKLHHGDADAPADALEPYPGEEEPLHERLARLEDRIPASDLAALRADVGALEARFAKGEER